MLTISLIVFTDKLQGHVLIFRKASSYNLFNTLLIAFSRLVPTFIYVTEFTIWKNQKVFSFKVEISLRDNFPFDSIETSKLTQLAFPSSVKNIEVISIKCSSLLGQYIGFCYFFENVQHFLSCPYVAIFFFLFLWVRHQGPGQW